MLRQFGWICVLAAGSVFLMAGDCSAQLGRQLKPIQNTGRFLGMGYGRGYHRCNPGHDTSYYQPWSAKNSFLISQSPEYLARFGQQDQTPLQLLQSGQTGYSAYGQPTFGGNSLLNNSSPYGQPLSPAADLNADFRPYSNQNRKEDDNDESESGSEFDAPPLDTTAEDQFDKEADSLSDDPDVGSLKDLREELGPEKTDEPNSDADDDSASSVQRNVFLNSRFSRN